MNDSDHPYKRLFSHPEMIADLVRGFLNPSLAPDCDFTKPERCNVSYVFDDLRDREDDIIWKLAYGDRTLILSLLIEYQSKPDYHADTDHVIHGPSLAGSHPHRCNCSI